MLWGRRYLGEEQREIEELIVHVRVKKFLKKGEIVTCQGLNKYHFNSYELLNEMAYDAMENYIVVFIYLFIRGRR